MQTLNQALDDLLMRGMITKEQAFLRTMMLEDLKTLYESREHN